MAGLLIEMVIIVRMSHHTEATITNSFRTDSKYNNNVIVVNKNSRIVGYNNYIGTDVVWDQLAILLFQ